MVPMITALMLCNVGRRAVIVGGSIAAHTSAVNVPRAAARTPGSSDLRQSIEQIKDARAALQKLRDEWSTYAVIDAEGRAGNIDAARRILGGVAPQRGDAAIEVAKVTPLYRIDGAFAAVRKAALASDGTSWGSALDVDAFVEQGEDIVFALKRADDSFYGVVFASKGSQQLAKIYGEARDSVDLSLRGFDSILSLLKESGAPGL